MTMNSMMNDLMMCGVALAIAYFLREKIPFLRKLFTGFCYCRIWTFNSRPSGCGCNLDSRIIFPVCGSSDEYRIYYSCLGSNNQS